jgi:hypothetical protein
MVSVLRPGGRLVLEEADPALQPLLCLEDDGPAQQLANRLRAALRQPMADRGVDLAYDRTLPRRLREAGEHGRSFGPLRAGVRTRDPSRRHRSRGGL